MIKYFENVSIKNYFLIISQTYTHTLSRNTFKLQAQIGTEILHAVNMLPCYPHLNCVPINTFQDTSNWKDSAHANVVLEDRADMNTEEVGLKSPEHAAIGAVNGMKIDWKERTDQPSILCFYAAPVGDSALELWGVSSETCSESKTELTVGYLSLLGLWQLKFM